MASFTVRMSYGDFSFSASSSSNGVSPHVDSARQTGARGSPVILELRLDKIRRPLMRTRANDPNKVQELMDSIRLIGLQVPVDDRLYFIVPQVSPAVIGTKLISASASLPSVAKFAREQRRP